MSGTSTAEAADKLNEMIRRYHEATRKGKIRTRLRIAGLVLAASAGAAVAAIGGLGDPQPLAAASTAAAGAGGTAALERAAGALRTTVPDYLLPGALFHEARERFKWY